MAIKLNEMHARSHGDEGPELMKRAPTLAEHYERLIAMLADDVTVARELRRALASAVDPGLRLRRRRAVRAQIRFSDGSEGVL